MTKRKVLLSLIFNILAFISTIYAIISYFFIEPNILIQNGLDSLNCYDAKIYRHRLCHSDNDRNCFIFNARLRYVCTERLSFYSSCKYTAFSFTLLCIPRNSPLYQHTKITFGYCSYDDIRHSLLHRGCRDW